MTKGFGAKLRMIRVVKGFSQEHVAEELGISVRSYQRYESSQSTVDLDLAIKISKFYGISIDDLYTYSEKKINITEPQAQKFKGSKVVVSVELDGRQDNLDMWIRKLTAINQVL